MKLILIRSPQLNKLNHTLRLAKRLYYEKKLQDVKSNTHATWKILNEVLNRKKSKPPDPEQNLNGQAILSVGSTMLLNMRLR